MRTLASLDSPISSLVVSPDGSMVVTSSSEGIGFLDLSSGRRSVTPLDEEVSRLAWGPDGLLAGTSTGEVWSVGDAPARLFEAIDEEISGIAATIDGTIAVCGGEPFAVATFGPHGNEEWRGEPDKWPYCVRFSPDGKLLAVATWDGYLFVFDAHDLPDELDNGDGEPAGGPIFDVRFLPGDRVLIVGASFVRVWDRGAGSYTSSRELDAEAFAVAVAPDGSCAVVSTNDQRLRLFALPELSELGQLSSGNNVGKALSSFPDYAEFCHVKGPATIRSLAFHPDGTRLFGATEDRRIVEVARAELQQVAVQVAAPPARVRVEPAPAPAPPKIAPVRAATAGKSIVKKPAAKKTAAKSAAAKKKKPAVRKPAARKAAARTPAARTPAARKPAARKPSKKAAQRRSGR
ncbi:MAG TPA: hypothetical protein VFD36_20015 [Kofleriaceae bacterium]|nr:hypothetical protein [Kofleriaceae bacterium]